MDYLIVLVIYYFIGSIPFAIIFSKIFDTKNPLEAGSKNPGATNMWRIGSKKSAVFTFFFDFMKGFLTLFISNKLFGSIFYDLVIFIIIGHCFSIFIKFKGGKGVAAFLGILLFLQFKLFLIAVTVWGLVFIVKKTSSIAALISIIATLISNVLLFHSEIFSINLICILVFLMHYQNIYRIITANEKKIS